MKAIYVHRLPSGKTLNLESIICEDSFNFHKNNKSQTLNSIIIPEANYIITFNKEMNGYSELLNKTIGMNTVSINNCKWLSNGST